MRLPFGSIVIAAAAFASAATAQGRPDTRAMTCHETQSLLAQEGAVVLTTGQYTYDRYVADGRFCLSHDEITKRATVPTRDDASCPVLECVTADFDDPFRRP